MKPVFYQCDQGLQFKTKYLKVLSATGKKKIKVKHRSHNDFFGLVVKIQIQCNTVSW